MNYPRDFIGEALGTFVLTLFGCGSVEVTVLFGAHQGLLQIALAWGIGVTLAIYLTRHLSNAHLNPAVSNGCGQAHEHAQTVNVSACPVYRGQPAGLVLYSLFAPSIAAMNGNPRENT